MRLSLSTWQGWSHFYFSNILLIHEFSLTIFSLAISLYIANITKSANNPHIIIVILVNVLFLLVKSRNDSYGNLCYYQSYCYELINSPNIHYKFMQLDSWTHIKVFLLVNVFLVKNLYNLWLTKEFLWNLCCYRSYY